MRYAASQPVTAVEQVVPVGPSERRASASRAASAARTARPVLPWPPRTAITGRIDVAGRRRRWRRRGTQRAGVEQLPAGPLKEAERRPGHAAAQAYPLHTQREERGRVGQAREARHDVERRRDRSGEAPDVVLLDDARHEDAVGAGAGVPNGSLHRFVEHVAGRTAEPGVCPRVEDEGAGGRRGAGGRDPLGGLVDPEQGPAHLILEVAADGPSLDRAADGRAHVVVPGLQVGCHRHADRSHDPGDVLEHGVQVQRATVRALRATRRCRRSSWRSPGTRPPRGSALTRRPTRWAAQNQDHGAEPGGRSGGHRSTVELTRTSSKSAKSNPGDPRQLTSASRHWGRCAARCRPDEHLRLLAVRRPTSPRRRLRGSPAPPSSRVTDPACAPARPRRRRTRCHADDSPPAAGSRSGSRSGAPGRRPG